MTAISGINNDIFSLLRLLKHYIIFEQPVWFMDIKI